MIFHVKSCTDVSGPERPCFKAVLVLKDSEYGYLHIAVAEDWIVTFDHPLAVGQEVDFSLEAPFNYATARKVTERRRRGRYRDP